MNAPMSVHASACRAYLSHPRSHSGAPPESSVEAVLPSYRVLVDRQEQREWAGPRTGHCRVNRLPLAGGVLTVAVDHGVEHGLQATVPRRVWVISMPPCSAVCQHCQRRLGVVSNGSWNSRIARVWCAITALTRDFLSPEVMVDLGRTDASRGLLDVLGGHTGNAPLYISCAAAARIRSRVPLPLRVSRTAS